MDNERQTLEEKIDELQKTLERLEEEWSTYYERVSRMTVSKLTDPRYPLTDWELHHLPSQTQRSQFRALMTALQNRLSGKVTPHKEQLDIDGISRATLYSSTVPSVDEVMDALKAVTGGTDRTIVTVMEAAKEEFDVDYTELADFVLDSIKLVKR
jgi:hypothetical protein